MFALMAISGFREEVPGGISSRSAASGIGAALVAMRGKRGQTPFIADRQPRRAVSGSALTFGFPALAGQAHHLWNGAAARAVMRDHAPCHAQGFRCRGQ